MNRVNVAGISACLAVLLMSGCTREKRPIPPTPDAKLATDSVRLSDVQPGEARPAVQLKNPYEENAYAVGQGKQLFTKYNCNGCHSQGGGGMGPALMDEKWIYGSEPQNIFATISQGRPNGMPSFGGHIPDDQIWQLVAYVRSMSGLVRSDVAPSRNDTLQGPEPEGRREKETPENSTLPQSSKQ